MRNIKNKAKTVTCKECNEEISSYGLSSHIKFNHGSIDDYISKHGDFRKQKSEPTRKVNKVKCEICNREFSSVGMFGHLRDTHNMSPDDYISNGYTEYRAKYIIRNSNIKLGEFVCKICDKSDFVSHQEFAHHIAFHDVDMISYVKKYIFNNESQLCNCGCGNEVSYSVRPPYRLDFISGHNSVGELNPMFGKTHAKKSKLLMTEKAIKRGVTSSKKFTKPELTFMKFMDDNNIKYQPQYPHEHGLVDFYLIDYDMFVEIDGEYFHPTDIQNLNTKQLSAAINDFKKNKNITKLYRIRANDVVNIKSIDDIKYYDSTNNHNSFIGYYDVVVSKKYLLTKTPEYINKNLFLFTKFITTFQPNFPKIETVETIEKIKNIISNYDLSKVLEGNVFKNNIYSIGNGYLKSNFQSYWKSKYKGNPSPYDTWSDVNTMQKVISYRLGLNSNRETFDFSIHQVVRGISSIRRSVSFFKPLLAAAIYDTFLENKITPKVFDPCCGFGGRLLGFKSRFPNGTYIGCEPNIETYNELLRLAQNFDNVYLYNCKVEDFDMSILENIDLSFSSIPYYDVEIYSNNTEYKSFDEWVDTFIATIKKCPKLIINVPSELVNLFDGEQYLLKNNTSHFNKTNKFKTEFIIKTF